MLATLGIALKAIFAGNFKPHRVTYGIFTLITLVTFVNQIINGGGYSSYFIGISFIGVVIVFTLSFKFGVGGTSRLDRVALVASFVLTLFWITTRESRLSTLIAIAIDFVALVPTITKAFKRPETEVYLNWSISAVGGFVSIFAIQNSDWILYVFPIYIVFGNFLVVTAKYFGSLKLQNQKASNALGEN